MLTTWSRNQVPKCGVENTSITKPKRRAYYKSKWRHCCFWRKTSYISVHIGGSPRRSQCQTFELPTFLHSTPRLLRLQQWTIHSSKGKGYAYTLKKESSKNLEICQNGGHVKITYDFHTLTI
jgi:hypothetical protein